MVTYTYKEKIIKGGKNMKNIMKKLVVLVLTLVMIFSMTSCDIVLEVIEILIGDEVADELTKRDVKVLADEETYLDRQNPYYGLHSGYNVIPASSDGYVWVVESIEEVDRVFDYAIANFLESVTIDFAAIMGAYEDFEYYFKHMYLPYARKELEHITTYTWTSEGSVATFYLEYDSMTASYHTPKTEENTYESYKNVNMLIRDYLDGEATRSKQFDDFAINKNNAGEMPVYNSETLWWALEHNYLPVFPEKNTKAEAFYNEAKRILREIINDDMTDYEKTLAIFEYLVDRVEYDYDALQDDDPNNVCYFLEGVFEYNRAVCDGKSKAFVLLCSIEGIECLRDYGTSYYGGAGHAWNYVKIDGTWYMVDTTAGDGGVILDKDKNIRAEIVDYRYFLCEVDTYRQGYGTSYHYSGIWDSVLEDNDNKASLADEYYDNFHITTEIDFVVDCREDIGDLLRSALLVMDNEAGVKYTLKFDIVSNSIEISQVASLLSGNPRVKGAVVELKDGTCLLVLELKEAQ
jgi:hypothetical protein